ncbi:11764_t:CDS:2, partial [Paraglomus brasilianum]
YNSGNTEKRFDAKMTASLKKQQKFISGLSETVKHFGYAIREVRDGSQEVNGVIDTEPERRRKKK